MTATTPCYRHTRGAWMVACPECNAWHMEVELARRDEVVATLSTGRTRDRTASPSAGMDVLLAALHLAA
jgi:hypothetical protein